MVQENKKSFFAKLNNFVRKKIKSFFIKLNNFVEKKVNGISGIIFLLLLVSVFEICTVLNIFNIEEKFLIQRCFFVIIIAKFQVFAIPYCNFLC